MDEIRFFLAMVTLTQFRSALTWDQCDLCNPDLKDMLNELREQIDKIEEKFFSCCPECPAGYKAISGHCYRLSHDRLPWQQAMDSCVMQGARLVSIETQDKQEALEKFVKKQTGNSPQNLAFYTSGNSDTGQWTWGQGQEAKELTYKNWADQKLGYESDRTGRCLIWQVGQGWNAVSCSSFELYICEHISDTDITQSDFLDYSAAARMNVEYLQGQGLGSDDADPQGQSQGHFDGGKMKALTDEREMNYGVGEEKDFALRQVAAPVRTTEMPPGGTTQLTPRTPVTSSSRKQ